MNDELVKRLTDAAGARVTTDAALMREAADAIRDALPQDWPVARVAGWYGGHTVVEPLVPYILPVGMALYAATTAASQSIRLPARRPDHHPKKEGISHEKAGVGSMKERPILFQGAMVRAILSGQKTQTRRLVKPQPDVTEQRLRDLVGWTEGMTLSEQVNAAWQAGFIHENCPYGQPGDRLWVREGFYAFGRWETRFSEEKGRDEWHFIDMTMESGRTYSCASSSNHPLPMGGRGGVMPAWWRRPSIHMPRSACRLVLEIVSVRVERLQDLSEADAAAEGLSPITKDGGRTIKYGIPDRDGLPGNDDDGWSWGELEQDPRRAFRRLWEHINGAESWEANSWVWVVEFRKVQP